MKIKLTKELTHDELLVQTWLATVRTEALVKALIELNMNLIAKVYDIPLDKATEIMEQSMANQLEKLVEEHTEIEMDSIETS